MRSTRARNRPFAVRRQGHWRAGAWYLLAFLCAGIVLVASVPLAGRLALAGAADGFSPATLAVERVAMAQRGGGRWFAHGHLADGSAARVPLAGSPEALRARLEQKRHGEPPPSWPVLFNPALSQTWLHRQRVQPPGEDLRGRAQRDALLLLVTIVTSGALGVFAFHRLRRWAQRPGMGPQPG